jgi:hypothetical protein
MFSHEGAKSTEKRLATDDTDKHRKKRIILSTDRQFVALIAVVDFSLSPVGLVFTD